MEKLYVTGHYIYESPDHGNTVYAREFNSTDRVLVGENLHNTPTWRAKKDMIEAQIWCDIKLAAKENPALAEAIERVIMIYELTKENPNG